MSTILIVLGAISIIIYVWSTIMIYSFLKDKNEKIQNFVFINLFIFKYIKNYKLITKNETGKIGYLFYLWLFAINLALICVILLMVL